MSNAIIGSLRVILGADTAVFDKNLKGANKKAHMWFNLAAAQGGEAIGASKGRDDVAKRLTASDISEAQRRARACLASNYQNCD